MVAISANHPIANRVYSLDVTREALQQLLGQVEAELLRSDIFHQALDRLQQPHGDSAPNPKVSLAALRAVGREAIRLAVRRVIRQYEGDRPSSNTLHEPSVAAVPSVPPRATLTPLPSPDKAVNPNPSPNPSPSAPASHPAQKPRASSPSRSTTPPVSSATKPKTQETERREAALVQIGQTLQQARQAQGLTLDYLHLKTWVPAYHIKALENGQSDSLPEDIYIQGFVRRLAPLLKLDAQDVLAPLTALAPKPVTPAWQPMQKPTKTPLQPVHLYVGYAALMAGAAGGLVWMSQQPEAAGWMDRLPDLQPAATLQQAEPPAEATEVAPEALVAPAPISGNGGAIATPETSPPETNNPI